MADAAKPLSPLANDDQTPANDNGQANPVVDPQATPANAVAPSPVESTQSSPAPEPSPAVAPEVTFGKMLSVPDNFLGAGYTGRGWTIVGSDVKNGQGVVKLSRRVKTTGAVETHEISADLYQQAKAYKDRQGGASKNVLGPALKPSELGKALDAAGEIIPTDYDAATRSYRVRLPGARTPEWVSDNLVRELRQGKPGALSKIQKAVGLDASSSNAAASSATASAGGVVAGAAASAIIGKRLAKRLGLIERHEQDPDRPSEDTARDNARRRRVNAKNKNVAEVAAEERAAREAQAREQNKRLRRTDRSVQTEDIDAEEDEETEEKTAQGAGIPLYRTIQYKTQRPGTATNGTADNPAASTRVATTRQTTSPQVQPGTPLRIPVAETSVTKPSTSPSSPDTPESSPPSQAERYTQRREDKTEENLETADPVQAVLERQRERKNEEQRFKELEKNKEFQKLLFADVKDLTPKAREQVLKQALAEWDKQQTEKAIQHIDTEYEALAEQPEFQKLAHEIGLEHLKNDPDPYFREKVAEKNLTIDNQGWIRDQQTGKNLGHVYSIGLNPVGGLATHHQIKYKAIQAWRASHPASPAFTEAQTLSAGGGAPQGNLQIRQMRELLGRQARVRQSSEGSSPSVSFGLSGPQPTKGADTGMTNLLGVVGALAGAGAGLGMAQSALGATLKRQAEIASGLAGLTREQALQKVQADIDVTLSRSGTLRREAQVRRGSVPPGQAVARESFLSSSSSTTSPASSSLNEPKAISPTTIPSSVTDTQTGTQTAALLTEAQQNIAALQRLEEALQNLPPGSVVPMNIGMGAPLEVPTQSTTQAGSASSTTPVLSTSTSALPQNTSSSGSIPPSAPATSPVLATPNTSAADVPTLSSAPSVTPPTTSGTRVGLPPVPSRTGTGSRRGGAPTNASRLRSGLVLPAALSSMTGMNALQAQDRGRLSPLGDTYESVLGQDHSSGKTTTTSSPLSISDFRKSKNDSSEEAEDVLATTGEQAEAARDEAEQAQATQAQFTGEAPNPVSPIASPSEEQSSEVPPPDTTLTPTDQRIAAIKMQAAQERDKKDQAAQSPETSEVLTTRTQTSPPSFWKRWTKPKLAWDVIEGIVDESLGWFQFLTEANIALVNDKYFNLAIAPSLKGKLGDERAERYARYGIYLLDGLIITAVAILTFGAIIIIYLAVGLLG